MRAMLLVTVAALGQCTPYQGQPCQAQDWRPRIINLPTSPQVVERTVQVHHMKDCKGQDWTHADPAFLARWIKERDAAFKAAEAAEASKKAENFGLNLAGIQAQAKGTLDTNDREFGERVMNPPAQHEEVPIPDPPAPDTADDYKVTLVLIGCVLFLILVANRGSKK